MENENGFEFGYEADFGEQPGAETGTGAQGLFDKLKELLKDGGASRVLVKRDGKTLVNVSVNAGLFGALAGLHFAPFAAITAALVSYGMDCEIEIIKKDGTVVRLKETELGEKLENAKKTVKDAARSIFNKEQEFDGVVYDSDLYEDPAETSAEDD